MKGLLHSKLFRDNLKKWLLMYVGTLCILTSVVTYSKYITELRADDSTRVAKFAVKINYLDECIDKTADEVCIIDNVRPMKEYVYNFQVDTRGMEVTTFLVTTATVSEQFEIVSLYEIVDDGDDIEIVGGSSKVKTKNETIKAGEGKLTTYKLVVKCIDYGADDNFTQEHIFNNFLVVNYSAKQLD